MEGIHHDSDHNRRQQLFKRYKLEVIAVSTHDRRSASSMLRGSITNFLCQVEPKSRLNPVIQHVFGVNIQADPMWNLAMAGRSFRHFEKYALNLLTFPWKREFWTVRSYSGFLKTQIEPFLNSYETLFALIGYCFNEENGNFEVVDPPLTSAVRLHLAEVAFELFVAAVECKVLHDIYNSVNHFDNFTVVDVYLSRSKNCGSVASFIERLAGSHRQDVAEIGVSAHQNLWCCALCSNKNPVHSKVCHSCLQPDFDNAVPGQPVKTLQNRSNLGSKSFVTSARQVDATIARKPQTTSIPMKGEYHSQKTSPVEEVNPDYKDRYRTTLIKGSSMEKKSNQKTWRCLQCGFENVTMISRYCSRCDTFYDATDFGLLVDEKRRSKLSELSDQNIQNQFSMIIPPSGLAIGETKNFDGTMQRKIRTRRDQILSSPSDAHDFCIVQQRNKEEKYTWKCVNCDIENKLETRRCRECGWKRLDDTLEHLSDHTLNSGQRHDNSKMRHGKKTLADLGPCDVVMPEQLSVWQCAWCTFANDPKIECCKICQHLRHTRPTN